MYPDSRAGCPDAVQSSSGAGLRSAWPAGSREQSRWICIEMSRLEGGRYVGGGQWHGIAASTFHKQAALMEQHLLQSPLVV